MKHSARKYYEITGWLDSLAKWVSILLIALMAAVVVVQVVARYVMRNPFPWTEELARYLMIWSSFVAMGHMVRNWDCVKVDFLVDSLGGAVGKGVRIFLRLVVLALCLVMVYLCWTVFPSVTRNQVTPALGISMLIPQSGIIVGMALVSIQALASICAEIAGIPSGTEKEGSCSSSE